jgi:hypothetical protein
VESTDKRQAGESGLEAAMQNSNAKLTDELLPEFYIVDDNVRNILKCQKDPRTDIVQLSIERAVLNFCLENGFQKYGAVTDALKYLKEGHKSNANNPEVKPYIVRLSSVIEDAYSKSVKELRLKNDEAKSILDFIVQRYSYCSEFQNALPGREDKPYTNPYTFLWEPSFKKLKLEYRKKQIASCAPPVRPNYKKPERGEQK